MYNRIIGLIGPTGSGKSYTAAHMMSANERCAVYQLKRIHEETAFAMVAEDIIDGDEALFARSLKEQQFRIVYLCKPPETEGKRLVAKDLDTFIQACYIRERMCMVIDEAHFFCDPWHIPVFFRQAVVMGRSRYLDTIYCAQKFSTISKELTANTHELYLWRIGEPGDLNSIAERCGEDCAAAVADLRPSVDNRKVGGEFIPGQYVHWTNTGLWEVIEPCSPEQLSATSAPSALPSSASQHSEPIDASSDLERNGEESLEDSGELPEN
jgi:hypothetical protein